MKFVITSLSAVLLFNFSFAQAPRDNDPKAKKILDELSKTTKSYKTITAEYTFSIVNKDKKQVEKQDGKIQVKGAKFHLEIPGNTIICDGKKVWTYNKDQGEITVKCFEPDNEDMLDPTKIFTMYEKGFKCKFEKEEKNSAGTVIQIINLYPTVKPEKKKYHTAKLYIDKVKKQIKMLKLMMKDGGTQTFEVKKFSPDLVLPDAVFMMDTKGKEVIDECMDEGKP